MRRPIYLFLLTVALCSCSSDKQSEVDRRQSGSQDPERIITLAPSATGLVVALGQTSKIIGRDQFSTSPPELMKLPVLGDFVTPNVEAIAGLTPDLVLLDESQSRALKALDTLGVRTLPLTMHQLGDVRSGLIEVGAALGQADRAKLLVAEIDAQVQLYAAKGKARVDRPVVLAIIDRDPDHLRNLVAAGPNTYLGELLTLVGARNMLSGSSVRYPQISSEQILRSAPDIIIDLSKSQGGLEAYQAVAEAPAVKNRRVHMVTEPLLLSPSAKIGEALARVFALTELRSSL